MDGEAAPGTPPTGVAPPDPSSPQGAQVIQKRVQQVILEDNPAIGNRLALTAAGWIVELHGAESTVEKMAQILDKVNVYYTRSRHQVPEYVKKLLKLMVDHDDIVEGIHYLGPVSLTGAGAPRINNENKAIKITPQGAFVMFGQLINDAERVRFLNSVFKGMLRAVTINSEMKQALDTYKAAYQEAKQNRCEGMASLRGVVSGALGITPKSVDCLMMNTHKKQYKLYFMGKEPTPAMREAGLLQRNEKAGKIWPQFSPHGQLADNFRLSTNAQAIRLRQAEIESAPDLPSKKRVLKEVVSACEDHFRENKVFEIPGATRIQNTRAFINREPIVKRARTGS